MKTGPTSRPKPPQEHKSVSLTITGPPRTKKNSSVFDLRGPKPRKLPSKPFETWNKSAQFQLAVLRFHHPEWPINLRVNVAAAFYRASDVGDAVGYYQALADALQEGGVVTNDALIVQWDGSRMLKDSENPRIEVTLEVL